MTTQTLEQTLEDFRRQCESFAREQQPRCGLIYELYQRRLSAVIDGYLAGVPAEYREELIAVARREFDYLTQDEIAEEIGRIGKTIIAATVLSVIVARWAAEI